MSEAETYSNEARALLKAARVFHTATAEGQPNPSAWEVTEAIGAIVGVALALDPRLFPGDAAAPVVTPILPPTVKPEPERKAKASKKRERPAAGVCPDTGKRHRYGEAGVCSCGAKRRGAEDGPPADTRTLPVPGTEAAP